jgi:hypothetical protein
MYTPIVTLAHVGFLASVEGLQEKLNERNISMIRLHFAYGAYR